MVFVLYCVCIYSKAFNGVFMVKHSNVCVGMVIMSHIVCVWYSVHNSVCMV